jgi:hypothetical protein
VGLFCRISTHVTFCQRLNVEGGAGEQAPSGIDAGSHGDVGRQAALVEESVNVGSMP